jgi:methyl-accepting chemotaxis protein
MKLQNRLFLSVAAMALAAFAIGILCVQSLKGQFENQARVYNSGAAVFHLKKVSDAYGLDVIGAVQRTRVEVGWSWEDGLKIIQDAEKSADEHWKAYMALDKSKEEANLANIVNTSILMNKHFMEDIKVAYTNKDSRILEIQATSVMYPSITPITDNIRKLEDLNEKAISAAIDQSEKGFNGSFNFMAGVVAVLLIAGLFLGLWAATRAARPLASLVRGLDSHVEAAGGLSSQVAASASLLNSSLLESASQLQKAGASLEQAVSAGQQKSRESSKARNLSEEARNSLLITGDSADRATEYMKSLNQNAQKVFQVVKTIEDIAFQTNILALNAGVEAVRAGEAGKEFVVVVEEIRNLSQKCSQVARETSHLVTENARQASDGLKLTELTGKSIEQATEKVGKMSGLLGLMEEGADQQSRNLQEIRSQMSNVERDAYRNSALAEKAGFDGKNLTKQLEGLGSISKQLASLILGMGKAMRAPAESMKQAVPPLSASGSSVTSAPAEMSASDAVKLGELNGTEDGKVIRMTK